MSPKEKHMAVAKTTKMVLKGDRGVEKNVQYRAVQKRDLGRYSAQIKHLWTKIRVWLGKFDTAVEAAKAYDAVAIKFRGMKVKTNFPFPTPPVNLPPRQSSSIESVNRMLAVELPLPLDLSFGRSYSSSSIGISTNGIDNFMFENSKFRLSSTASGFLPLNQWCCKEKAVFIQGGGCCGTIVPIIGASYVIDFMGSGNCKHIDIDLNYPSAPEDM
ncbi:hypothetical protein H5410_061596 [Solanum commersonii]|uniref:AP2/ERF domain-containing protein n=1 Tax=Solanum commersonii TaxID=4109 RepID=A0A9J5WA38_SOLCO|nr:hypothetical protein H5410_061596 [Solanum commersonii]